MFVESEQLDPLELITNKYITLKDLTTLQINQKVNDAVINALIQLIKKVSPPNIIIMYTYFLTKSFNISDSTRGELRFCEDHWSGKWVSLDRCEKIFLPLLHSSHYTLYCCDINKMRIEYYDPMNGESYFPEIRNLVVYWCRRVHKSLQSEEFQWITGETTPQQDSNDCGIVMILTLLSKIYDKPLPSSYKSVDIRLAFENWIIGGNIDQRFLENLWEN